MADVSPHLMTLFTAARERPPGPERAAYLDGACGGDAALRAEVEALLAVSARAGGFLEGAVKDDERTAELQPVAEAPGTVVGPYKLIEKIGEGGMGSVWMAQQTEPVRRLVAVKLIKPGMDSRQVLARFEAERQALAMMDHPNIAKVLDAGTTDAGRPYFVMDLVRGVPITKYCDDHRLTPRQRLELFVPVCQAIQHAHQKGIIHRDLKPSNVLVALYDGRPVPKVIDFGIAKAAGQPLTDKTLVTGFGAIVGTPEYMSPEQAEVNQLDIDTRSDIYSLGVVLYELLAGSPPFTRKDLEKAGLLEMLRVIREQEPSKPSTKLSTAEGLPTLAASRGTEPAKLTKLVRGELDWIVMKALEKDRNRRYETANGFAMDVQRYLADEQVLACPPSVAYRLRKFVRRNKAVLAAATVMAIAVLVAAASLLVSNVRITHEAEEKTKALEAAKASEENAKIQAALAKTNADNAESERRGAVAQERIAKAQEQTARRYLYAAHMTLAGQARERGQMGRVLELLEGHRPQSGQEDLRGFEWYHLWGLCHRGHRSTWRQGAEVTSVAFSPDGKTLASANSDGTVRLSDTATGQARATLKGHSQSVSSVAFSPDGKTLASGSRDSTVIIWDIATGKARATLLGHTNYVGSVAFSPDGRTLASGSLDFTIKLWDPVTGQERTTLKGHTYYVASVAFSHDGKYLASGGVDDVMILWDLATGRQRLVLRADKAMSAVRSVAFSRDGKNLAAGTQAGNVTLWDPATGQQRATFEGHGDMVRSVAFSPDGKTVASGSADRTVRLWDTGTGQQQRVYGHLGWVNSVTFSPDGATLASGSSDGSVKLWEAATVEEQGPIKAHAGPISAIAFSPDGRTIASAGERSLKLWDVATAQVRANLKGHTGHIVSLAFSPDGKTLASAGAGDDWTVRLWDVATGKELFAFKYLGSVLSVAFSSDGKTLALGLRFGGVKLWDVANRVERPAQKVVDEWVLSVAFSHDGARLAWANWTGVRLRDVITGEERATSKRNKKSDALCVAFSTDDRILASGHWDGTVTLWDPTTGEERSVIQSHTASVWFVTFLPDGKTLAAVMGNGTVMLWDVASGQERATLKDDTERVVSLAFSPVGSCMATGGSEGTMKLWRAATEAEVAAQSSIERTGKGMPPSGQ